MLEPDRHASDAGTPARPWRGALRRELAWILVLKFAALTLLWALFFRGGHQSLVNTQALAERLGLSAAVHPAAPREAPRD